MTTAHQVEQQLSEDQRLTLTIAEACAALGVGETTLRQMMRVGQLPVLRIGRRVLIPRHAVVDLVAGVNGDAHGPGARLERW
jgi:excisionase family DNA binding protein